MIVFYNQNLGLVHGFLAAAGPNNAII